MGQSERRRCSVDVSVNHLSMRDSRVHCSSWSVDAGLTNPKWRGLTNSQIRSQHLFLLLYSLTAGLEG